MVRTQRAFDSESLRRAERSRSAETARRANIKITKRSQFAGDVRGGCAGAPCGAEGVGTRCAIFRQRRAAPRPILSAPTIAVTIATPLRASLGLAIGMNFWRTPLPAA